MRRPESLLGVIAAFMVVCGGCGSAAVATPIGPADTGPAATAPAPAGTPATLPAGPLDIATIGDSLTEGQGDDASQGYQGRLQALLDAKRTGTTFLNVGHSGWTSADVIDGKDGEPAELARVLGASPAANVAFVWIGSNDLWYLYEYGPEPMTADAEQQDLTAYETNMDRIVHDLAGRDIVVYVALLDDQSKRPVVATPADPPAFPGTTRADLALMSAHVKAYNEIIRRVAAKYHATTVDFYDTTIFTDPATIYSDGNHPNSAGYERIAQIWLKALGY